MNPKAGFSYSDHRDSTISQKCSQPVSRIARLRHPIYLISAQILIRRSKVKTATFTQFTLCLNLPKMYFHNVLDEGQAKPAAPPCLVGVIGQREITAQIQREVLDGDAGACVTNGRFDRLSEACLYPSILTAAPNSHPLARGC